jgi:serine/threonine-protein kinase
MNEETLFHEALARTNLHERAAFLEQACAGQPELRAAVEALLAAHEVSDSLLDKPPGELGEMVDSDPSPANPDAANARGEFTPAPGDAPKTSGASSPQLW